MTLRWHLHENVLSDILLGWDLGMAFLGCRQLLGVSASIFGGAKFALSKEATYRVCVCMQMGEGDLRVAKIRHQLPGRNDFRLVWDSAVGDNALIHPPQLF